MMMMMMVVLKCLDCLHMVHGNVETTKQLVNCDPSSARFLSISKDSRDVSREGGGMGKGKGRGRGPTRFAMLCIGVQLSEM